MHIISKYIIYQGAYIRSLTLIIMEEIIQKYIDQVKLGNLPETIVQLGEALTTIMISLLNLNLDKKQMAKSDQPFSDPHRLKLRTWQMLTVMQTLLTDAQTDLLSTKTIQIINDALWPILKQNHLSNVRQYMECFTIKFVLRYPQLTLKEGSLFYETCLETKSIKPALTASLLLIAGFALLHTDTNSCLTIKRRIFDKFIGFAGSNSAHCRSIAQYFILKLNQIEPALIGSALQPLIKYMSEAKDIKKMMGIYQKILDDILYKQLKLQGALAVLHEQLQIEGEHIGINLIEELNRSTTEVMCEFRSMDEIPIERRDWWKSDLELRKKSEHFDMTVQEESQNYQRKILPWEQVEFDATLQKRVFFQRRRQEIIICATLIDKVANLAGLARTSEIMNTSSLIINNSEVCQLEEFKGISVTSEKWLPIYEVKEQDLQSYLLYQKSNGYKIVGVEQSANSTMLHEFKFPTRCVLLLGKEKEGIPQEYYSLLDFCVEVPQYGLIRSLNVHVTGALCLWEYTRQHMSAVESTTELKQ